MGEKFDACLRHINNYWQKIIFNQSQDDGIHIGLPNPFVSPNHTFFANDQFYWDSYFIILGLLASGKINLAKGMVDNFLFLYQKFKIIPARNQFQNLGISQPPFLTSMALEVFSKTQDKAWLKTIAKVAENELIHYWMNPLHHMAQGLSRYCDHRINHFSAEHESGWDMTSRFDDHCLDFLPVDLNSCLFKSETDLADIYRMLNQPARAALFEKLAAKRKQLIDEFMWNKKKAFFFDYNFVLKKQSCFYSLAGYYPLWANLATKEQAELLCRSLRHFEYEGGLANTQKTHLSKTFKQHDYPNGWPQQQWIVIKGLLNYGFKEDAKRLALKWIDLNQSVFAKTGKFWEKYNVVDGCEGKSGRYPTQKGFGWTNAIFVKLIKEFSLQKLMISRLS